MHSTSEIVMDALEAEADGYLLKNIGQKDFLESIDRIMLDGACYSHELIPIISKSLKKKSVENSSIILSAREKEVLQLIMQELTSKEIAEKLFISKQTVDTHRLNIMAKTKSKTLVGLIKYGISTNLISH
jgi:DNA-binding NarL/FixJ family response regulator